MIVSGFTRRQQVIETSLDNMTGQHSHCILCRQVSCSQFVDNVTACEMSTCPNCAFKFHACKTEEHSYTCQELRVPCVNAGNGCPHIVKRSRMSQHLPVCPASVVTCAEEWCRWPMHARDKGIRHSLPPSKTYLECGQLDVGLAMRDQRMLIDSLKAPHKLRHSLRNPLTLKYPAAPLTHRRGSFDSEPGASGDTSQTVSDDEADTPWDLTKRPPGLKASICSSLFKVSKETSDKLAAALNLTSDILAKKEVQAERETSVGAEDQKEAGNAISSSMENNDNDKNNTRGSPSRDMSRGAVRSSVSSDRMSDVARSRSVSVLRDIGGKQLHNITGEKLVDEDDPDISLRKILGVSLTYEVINKYVAKSMSMYTFICAQNFRRDEYKWHFKNVHQEIHQGLNGWIEQRCPLAYQGCTFSFQRLIPEQPDVVLYHSWLQESYGLKSLAQPTYLHDGCHCHHPHTSFAGHNDSNLNNQNSETLKNDDSDRATGTHQQQPNQPSISDLGNLDLEFSDTLSLASKNDFDIPATTSESGTGHKKDFSSGDAASRSRSVSCSDGCDREEREDDMTMTMKPVVFVGGHPESKVLFQYDVEEMRTRNGLDSLPALTSLPFELIRIVAKHLDSFSLCNLSLTCRRLREVCCSLLDDHGIVLLNWERQKTGDTVSWKVANKRWMFSTSFEPIKSWKFNPNLPSVADHLKTCPFNQDRSIHSGPVKVLLHA